MNSAPEGFAGTTSAGTSDIDVSLNAFGVAQVIVVLKQPAGEILSHAELESLRGHFTASPHSQLGALAEAAQDAQLAATAVPEPRPTVRYYPHLGVLYGAVNRKGLAALKAATQRVAEIRPTMPVSPVRPMEVTDVDLDRAVTWGIERLGISELWQEGLSGAGVRVGHLDTGVEASHPALTGAVVAFAEFDQFGRQTEPRPEPHDTDLIMGGHGTHTAATIAGRQVGGRRVGVAYGALLASAVVIEGGDIPARLLGGLDWAVGQGVRIVNISLGMRGWRDAFRPIMRLLRERQVLPVVAVGNEGPGTSRSPGNYAECLSVGAVDEHDRVWSYSSSQRFARQRDPIVPDLVAPGVNVVSARPGGGYRSMSGTSMAAPHVSGLAALLLEACPEATVDQVEQAIFASCERGPLIPPSRGSRGVPNGPRALAALLETGSRGCSGAQLDEEER